jgi:hypothetical protein
MRFRLGCNLSYEIGAETTFIFNLEVARIASQIILHETLRLTPGIQRNVYTEPAFGNRYFGATVSPGEFALDYTAEIELSAFHADPETVPEWPISALPLNILPFLLPSRFVPSDRLAAFAIAEFGSLPAGYKLVNAICSWIHDHLTYQPGTSNEHTTADETLLRRAGVCRDFAHLGIAFCRGLGIPARFVSCYAYGLIPGDFHAVFEAILAGGGGCLMRPVRPSLMAWSELVSDATPRKLHSRRHLAFIPQLQCGSRSSDRMVSRRPGPELSMLSRLTTLRGDRRHEMTIQERPCNPIKGSQVRAPMLRSLSPIRAPL